MLGNTNRSRQAIISFLVQTTTRPSSNELINPDKSKQNETDNKRSKPLHGRFVAKLLNDLFGVQARGGCACAAPYGHRLLNLNEPASSAIRSAIQKVVITYVHVIAIVLCDYSCIMNIISFCLGSFDRVKVELDLVGQE